jgi:hypothetical protein
LGQNRNEAVLFSPTVLLLFVFVFFSWPTSNPLDKHTIKKLTLAVFLTILRGGQRLTSQKVTETEQKKMTQAVTKQRTDQ